MTKICKKCGYWINYSYLRSGWYDEYDDDSCYDENLNYTGPHEPEQS